VRPAAQHGRPDPTSISSSRPRRVQRSAWRIRSASTCSGVHPNRLAAASIASSHGWRSPVTRSPRAPRAERVDQDDGLVPGPRDRADREATLAAEEPEIADLLGGRRATASRREGDTCQRKPSHESLQLGVLDSAGPTLCGRAGSKRRSAAAENAPRVSHRLLARSSLGRLRSAPIAVRRDNRSCGRRRRSGGFAVGARGRTTVGRDGSGGRCAPSWPPCGATLLGSSATPDRRG
jgi:hypothetical protein